MCGIAGFSEASNHKMDARKLSAALLAQIVERGYDATGMAWTDRDGELWYVKNDVDAYEFIGQSLDTLDPDAKTVILHTRWATKGSPSIEGNNHPIVRPGIVGVHNGVITNDDEIFDLLNVKRYAEVDSEAAFALIDESGMSPTESLTLLDGRVALGWMQTYDPHSLHVARVSGSPLAVGQSRLGTFVFASTLPMLTKAARMGGLKLIMSQEVGEGWYLRVKNGIIHDTLPIGVPQNVTSTLAKIGQQS